jgi:hypothetical protein
MAMPPGFSMPFQSFQMTPAMMKAARYPKQPKRAPPEEPNTTLYVHNLHDKKSKKMLKQELVYLFSKYGQVLDISVKKRLKMRGQAFVVFRELSSAEAAIKELQGSVLFNRPMVQVLKSNVVEMGLVAYASDWAGYPICAPQERCHGKIGRNARGEPKRASRTER